MNRRDHDNNHREPGIAPGEQIEIQQVRNGFIVKPLDRHELPRRNDDMVFCSIADLGEWLFKHFEVKHD